MMRYQLPLAKSQFQITFSAAMAIISQHARLAALSFLLGSCSPHSVDIGACMEGSRLAFRVGDTEGWFYNSTARPRSVDVFIPGYESIWITKLPYERLSDWKRTYQPKRRLIIYGDKYVGWEIRQKALPLKVGQEYNVTIWTDGGRGMLDIVFGQKLPGCAREKEFSAIS